MQDAWKKQLRLALIHGSDSKRGSLWAAVFRSLEGLLVLTLLSFMGWSQGPVALTNSWDQIVSRVLYFRQGWYGTLGKKDRL